MLSPIRGSVCGVCGPLTKMESLCPHVRCKFNSTKNSKRHVHTYLFWRRYLGFDFPVSDAMLQEPVWKSLEPCASGIKYVLFSISALWSSSDNYLFMYL